MSTLLEIESAVEQLQPADKQKLLEFLTDNLRKASELPPMDEFMRLSRGERARALMGAGRKWLKPGDDPIADLIRERELDMAEEDF